MSDAQDFHDAVVDAEQRLAENPPRTVVHRHYFELSAAPFSLPIYDTARIVHVGRKTGDPSATANIWEAHRTDVIRPAVLPQRWFAVRGTGHPIDGADVVHVATWIEGAFVWHLFEYLNGKP